MTLNFASDNVAPVAPTILDAMIAANIGSAMPYGNDQFAEPMRDALRRVLGMPNAEVSLVTNGTTANALALATLCPPFGAVLCHRISHINVDECGAPEFFSGGAKLVLVDGDDGKMTPTTLEAALSGTEPGVVHSVQPRVLSITNVTEIGTVYTLAEIAALQDIARAHGLSTHLDGARFGNACAALGCTAAELAHGFDMISFGATKNGCMGVEAVVIADADKAWEVSLRRKRAGHLWSKHRFLSSQMGAYLADDLWMDLATRANARGQQLAEGLRALPGATFTAEPQANMIFAHLPRHMHSRAMAAGAEYYLMDGPLDGPEDELVQCRLVCDWSKTEADIETLLALYRGS